MKLKKLYEKAFGFLFIVIASILIGNPLTFFGIVFFMLGWEFLILNAEDENYER